MFMSVKEFKALHWEAQNAALEPYMMAALQGMSSVVDTRRVMLEVANRVGWLDSSLSYLPGAGKAIGNVLRRFASHRPDLAVQDGEEFWFAGKMRRRWMWRPQPKPDESDLRRDIFA